MTSSSTLLTQWFSSLLHRRRRQHFFARPPQPYTASSPGNAAAPAKALAEELLSAARDEPSAAIERLQSHPDGLSAQEAVQRLRRVGSNEIEHEKPLPGWLHLWHCYNNPFNLLLTVLALISWVSSDAKATVVIGVMVVLSTLVRFVQEGRSHRAAESLKAMVRNTATVLRPKDKANQTGMPPIQQPEPELSMNRLEVPIRELVPGDLVALSAGDMIPADCRVLAARDLFVAQAAMTGESLPVEKFVQRRGDSEAALEQSNLVFMGTNVVSGTATALVVATGNRSYFGALASRVVATDRAPTAFQAGINSVSWLLIRFALVMVPIVFFVNGFTKGDWGEAFLFALSVAVGLTPEMLPMVVTSTLAKGAVALSRKNLIVKHLEAIQNFGAMDVLCTDKTGTLTQDKIALARKTDAFGATSDEVLHYAFLNSYYQTGLKNLLDHAVLAHLELSAQLNLQRRCSKIDEVPFDFQRRRMSVIVSVLATAGEPDRHELICKGAVEEVLAVCTHVRRNSGTQAAVGEESEPQLLDAPMRARAQAFAGELNQEGLRVVAVAIKQIPHGQSVYSKSDETELTLIGFIGFLDPPKESAAPALKALAAHGVAVKVLTGDNDLVTARVCSQVGLSAGTVLLGHQVEAMNDAELAVAVEAHQVFAKLAPLHKERIVRALRANGHVVGFMGDGINDAPALRAADIGISVDSAVDIAKEAADIILLKKSLMVLDDGVIEGRRTFCNMLKYIRMTASSNFGNVLSVLVASAFLPFLPMLPLQLLVQNLLYDFSQVSIPFDNVDAELVSKPLKWNPSDIGRFMLFFGPISSAFDISLFAVMWWVFSANTVQEQGLFRSGWFVVGLLTQTLVVHMIRTPKLPFIQSRPAPLLIGMTLAIMAVGLYLPMGPLAGYFKLEPLPAAYFAWLLAILVGYCVLTSWMKLFYVKRFGWQ